MAPRRSLNFTFFLIIWLYFSHYAASSPYIGLQFNSSSSSPTANKTYTVSDVSSNYTSSTISREYFDAVIEEWRRENPHLANSIPDESVEKVWQRISTESTVSSSPNATASHRKRSPKYRLPHYKRQNVTQSEMDKARAIVELAVAQSGENNKNIMGNPRSNKYILKPTNTTAKPRTRDSQPLLVPNATVASAATLVAEADAAMLAKDGTLYKDFTLTGKYAKYNQPGFPTGGKLKKRVTSYWLDAVAKEHLGNFPFGGDDSYFVYRNVKDYGARGDGLKDDTKAINNAIADGNRCGSGCGSSSVKGALIYFPEGTYLVSSPIISLYNTQLVGNPNDYPVILAAPHFVGLGVITSDVYIDGGSGSEWYINTNNFFRQIRNFVINLASCTTPQVAGIHWQVAQATSLQNIFFNMAQGANSTQIGVYSENGSGGFMSDLLFNGGNIGLQCGNQQFTTRDMGFLSCNIAVQMQWDWGWTWKSLSIEDCTFGIYFQSTIAGGSIYVLDSYFSGVGGSAIVVDSPSTGITQEQVLVNIDNVVLVNTPYVLWDLNANDFVPGGSTTIQSYTVGKIYSETYPDGTWVGGALLGEQHPRIAELSGGPNGGYFERSKPQYESKDGNFWLNAQLLAKGDGVTDDTGSLSFILQIAARANVGVYIPAGSYIVTSTLLIPVGSVVVGACWAQIVGTGSSFQDNSNGTAMVQVGQKGDFGNVEIQDLLFTTKGPTPGAVLVEWNVYQAAPGSAAMWDCHFRVGGALGTNLQAANCPTGSEKDSCTGPALMLHITGDASGYFENVWAWSADHDMDSPSQAQLNVFTGRGILIESQGPCWLYGTASEHSVLYQYNVASAENIYMGMIQTESPYYPPNPLAPQPFGPFLGLFPADPRFDNCGSNEGCAVSWALNIYDSTNIVITGAGLYSWFQNYDEACVDTQNCQQSLVNTTFNGNIYIFNLYTIGAVNMVVPTLSVVNTAIAKDNTVENAHPWLSAISGWVEIDPQWLSSKSTGTSNNGLCDFPKFGTVDPGTAANARHIAAYIHEFLTVTDPCDNCGSSYWWQVTLWNTGPGGRESCADLTSSNCAPPSPCDDYSDPSLYWAQNTIGNFHDYMVDFYSIFKDTTFISSLKIHDIISSFPINVAGNLASEAKLLSNLGAALSIAGGFLAAAPGEGPLGGAIVAGIGATLADVAGNFNGGTGADAESLLNDRLVNVFTNVQASLRSSMTDMFQNGNLSAWSDKLFANGHYGNDRIANFFDNGNFFYGTEYFDWNALESNLTNIIIENLVGVALAAANWYVLVGAYSQNDCATITSGQWINNACFTLEAPGFGFSDQNPDPTHTSFSVPVTSSTLSAITGYGVSLADIYTSSYNCQQQANAYDAIGNFTFDNLAFTIDIPDCFYTLPVFEVSTGAGEGATVYDSSPCLILVNNQTATEPAAGGTYLPDNLETVFGNSYCCALEGKEVICLR